MNAIQHRLTLIAAAVASTACLAGAAELTIYKQPNFTGGALTLRNDTANLASSGFQDQASSLVVKSGRWQLCTQPEFKGDCVVVERGEYAALDPKLNHRVESARELVVQADARDRRDDRGWNRDGYRDDRSWAREERGEAPLEMYAASGFRGRPVRVWRDIDSLERRDFDQRASSLIIHEGRWQLCSDPGFEGSCRVFEPGSYPQLGRLNNQIGSLRRVG